MKKLLLLTLLLLTFAPSHAQRPRYDKLSPMLRQMVRSQNNSPTSPTSPTPDPSRGGEGRIYSRGGKAAAELYTPLSNRRGVGGEASAAKLYPPLPPAGGAGGGASGASVLIIEDNQDIAFYIGMHLKGCRIIYARGMAILMHRLPSVPVSSIRIGRHVVTCLLAC